MKIDPDRTWTPLMSAVITQAFQDAQQSDNLLKKLDALIFLRGADFAIWAEAVGLPDIRVDKATITNAKRVFKQQRYTQYQRNHRQAVGAEK
jgi:hypothetical protein